MSLSPGLIRKAENQELPLLGLRAISEMRDELDKLQTAQIQAAREKGASWADIAGALGISRQALQQKMRALAKLQPKEPIRIEQPGIDIRD
ncbi:MAG: hypothetical protein ACLGIB_11125 [Actinomycetota bacterium]